jgi:hypothetical protein
MLHRPILMDPISQFVCNRVLLLYAGQRVGMANQPCVALVITILSKCMNCHREYTKPYFIHVHDSKSISSFSN